LVVNHGSIASTASGRIGVVAAGVNPRSASFFQAFEQRLRELGWVEGKNLVVDFQTPKGSRDLSAIAASSSAVGTRITP